MQITLLLAMVGFDIVGVWIFFRRLRYHPAPAIAGFSLRRAARRMLLPSDRRERWAVRIADHRQTSPWIDYLPYLVLVALLWAPAPLGLVGVDTGAIHLGPFGARAESRAFLETLWQVVAAAARPPSPPSPPAPGETEAVRATVR